MPDIRAAYGPFDAQAAYFRRKVNVPSNRWDDLMHGDHAHGFMVAGLTRMDVLDDIRQAVQDAIDKGETLEDFRKRFDDIVKGRWEGFTGDGSDAGRAWRTKVIYQTNLRTSYMAGRWETLKNFPYLRYQHNTLRYPREEHKAWDGKIIARDDPWWSVHYPPNGWGCRCSVTGVSEAGLRAMGVQPDVAPPLGNARQEPPPEWAYHVGRSARSMAVAERFGQKVMQLPTEFRNAVLDDAQRRSTEWFADWSARVAQIDSTLHSPGGASPVGFLPADVLDAAAQPVRRRHTAPALQPSSALVAIADRQVVHALHDLPPADRAIVAQAFAQLPHWWGDQATWVWRQVSPDRLAIGQPVGDGRFVVMYMRLGVVPAGASRAARVSSNWIVTAELRTPAQIADHVVLREGK